MRAGLVAVICAVLCLSGAAAQDFWIPYVLNEKGGSFALESRSREDFVIRGKRLSRTGGKETGCIAIGTYDAEFWTSKRLAISARSTNGRKVGVTVSLTFRDGTNSFVRSLPTFDVSGRGWRELSWSLDHDFDLGDRSVRVYQAKVIAWITPWREGEEGGLEVKNFRICNAADTAQSELWLPGDRFVSVPSREGCARLRPSAAPDALKVFFAFDNEDLEPLPIKGWKGEFDLPQCGGFREVMLEGAEGRADVTPELAAADVIVYSRARPDAALASEIVRRVRSGVPLYAAGEVRDPEIEAILPVTVSHDVLEDLPPRERILTTAEAPAAFRDGLSDATFGLYRSCAAKPDARTLLRFEGGSPAVAEGTCGKGKVVYSMVTIGASLVPGKEAMDAFFLRTLGYLSGRTLPERARAKAKVTSDGWRKGAGKGDFGRFGWNRGSELPVEDVTSRFVVRKGEAWYEMHFPRTVADKPRTFAYASRSADQLGFSGDVAIDGEPAYNVSGSIAYPGLRWDIRRPSVEMRMRNQLACLYLPEAGGGRTFDFSRDPSPVDARQMSANWFLVWNASFRDSPLLVVCQHRLKAIEPIVVGASVEGLRLVSAEGSLGVIVPTRPYGAKTADTTAWDRSLPAEARRLADEWSARALAYPVSLEEAFRIDEDRGRVEMHDRIGTLDCVDDWGTSPRPYAPVPPVASLLAEPTADGRTVFAAEGGVRDSGLVTRAGNLWFKDGARDVRWSVPLRKPDLGFYPHTRGFEAAEKAANRDFAEAVHYSSGGTRMDDVKQKYGKLPEHHTTCLNMHGLLLGMSRCLPNPYIYDEENRRLMRRRLAWRMLEPLEVFQYKMAVRWRVEPFTGSRYTIYMNSPRRMADAFEPPEYGSRTIFGDSNETVRMICHALQVAADRLGQYGVVRANWDAITRQVATYERTVDDWGILCSGCLELGGSGAIDMLNSEYGCWMSLARLAEIAGDGDFRAEALYRAARRLCPTLARNRALAYFVRNGLFEEPERWRASVGFGENGAQFHTKTRRVMDVELFDMSQGTPQDLISLYDWYGYGEMRRDYFPFVAAAKPGEGLDYITLATLAIGSDLPDAEIRSRLDALVARTLARKRPWYDWPGMDSGSFIEYTLHRLTHSPTVTDCRDTHVHDAQYDPKTEVLTLDVTPGANAALAVDGRPVPMRGRARQRLEVRPSPDGAEDFGRPKPKDWWWMRLAEKRRQVEAVRGKTVDVVLLGDSITHGWDYMPALERLRKNHSVLALGYNGDNVSALLWRVWNGELDGYVAKNVFILIGTNNLGGGGEQPEKVIAQTKRLLTSVREKQPTAKVWLLAVLPRDVGHKEMPALWPTRIAAYNALLKELADGTNVVYHDMGPKFLKADGALNDALFWDRLHPRGEGYEVWADEIEALLGSGLKK